VKKGQRSLTGEKERKSNDFYNDFFLSGPSEAMIISLLVPWISLLVKKDQVDKFIKEKYTN
jgi:hypothetical protein